MNNLNDIEIETMEIARHDWSDPYTMEHRAVAKELEAKGYLVYVDDRPPLPDNSPYRTAFFDPREVPLFPEQVRFVLTEKGEQFFEARAQQTRESPDSSLCPRNPLSITYMSGAWFVKSPMVQVYINSLLEHFPGEKIVLTHDMSKDDRSYLTANGIEVVNVPPPPSDASILRWRWKAYYEYLRDRSDWQDLVILTDCKDVLWQENPLSFVIRCFLNYGFPLVFCSEGVTHDECEWNTADQRNLRTSMKTKYSLPDFGKEIVLNGGVMAGLQENVQEVALAMYMLCMFSDCSTDQAVLNLYHQITKQDSTLGMFVASFDHPFCATGNTIQRGLDRPKVSWQNGKLCGPEGVYPLFHQWDRTEYRSEILSRYGQRRS